MTAEIKREGLTKYVAFSKEQTEAFEKAAAVSMNTRKGQAGKPLSQEETLIFPVEKPFRITSPYGWRIDPNILKREGRRVKKFHQGVDIDGASFGKPIFSMCDGSVIYSENRSGYGNAVRVRREDNVDVVYAHCAELFVRKGAVVKRGDKLATVGNTGRSTGPHLHIQVDDRNRKWVKGAGKSVHPDKWRGMGLWVRVPEAIADIRESISLPGVSPMLATVYGGAINSALGCVRAIQMRQVSRYQLAQAACENTKKRVASSGAKVAHEQNRESQLDITPPEPVADVTGLLYENNAF